MEQVKNVVFFKNEIFEQGVYPTPQKLTLINLFSYFQHLNTLASSDHLINIDQFKSCISNFIPFCTASDAEIYFITFKLLTEDDPSFLSHIQRKTPKQAT